LKLGEVEWWRRVGWWKTSGRATKSMHAGGGGRGRGVADSASPKIKACRTGEGRGEKKEGKKREEREERRRKQEGKKSDKKVVSTVDCLCLLSTEGRLRLTWLSSIGELYKINIIYIKIKFRVLNHLYFNHFNNQQQSFGIHALHTQI
jgi:hypothetical protein